MQTVQEVAAPLASICRAVPPIGPGICARCHGCPKPGWPICWSCAHVEPQVAKPCRLVVPISLYCVGGQLHHQLRTYKADSPVARSLSRKTAGILGYFLKLHSDCIAQAAEGRWTRITSVPSSTGRTGEHPLESAIRLLPDIRDEYERLLQPGSAQITHKLASDDGFQVLHPLAGERVLLIDDTFTSGARAQSAASALASAGATVIAILPIGRVISPDLADYTADYWQQQEEQVFAFETCCLCH